MSKPGTARVRPRSGSATRQPRRKTLGRPRASRAGASGRRRAQPAKDLRAGSVPRLDEARYREVVEDQTEAICRFKADGTFTFVNEVYCRFFGRSREELLGSRWQPRAVAEDLPLIEETLRALSPANPVVVIENRVHAAKGEVRWMQFVNRAFYDATGRLIEMQAVGRDTTERQQVEAASRKCATEFKAAEEIALVGHWSLDLTTGELYWSEQMYKMFGLDPTKGPPAWPDGHQSVFHPDDWEPAFHQIREALANARAYELTSRFNRPDGTVGHTRIIGRPLQVPGRRAPQFIGIVQDITEQRRAEETLQASRDLHRSILQTAFHGFWRTDLQGRLAEVNPAYCRMSGYTEAELLSLSVAELETTECAGEMLAHLQRVVAQGQHYFESRHRRKDGTTFDVEVSAQFRPADGGQMVAFLRDITDRKRLERERAGALARLAAVEEQERQRIARELHDQTAQGLVALAVELKNLETNLAAGRPQAARVQSLRRAVDELQEQVHQIAWNLRAGELVEGDLGKALQDYVEDWAERSQVPADCECRGVEGRRLATRVEATLHRVAQEALANVQRHAQAGRVSVLLECDADLARLTVEDDGCGFDVNGVQEPPESAHRLGLLGMKERVALAGGTLLVESSPGSGTTILVRVPLRGETRPT